MINQNELNKVFGSGATPMYFTYTFDDARKALITLLGMPANTDNPALVNEIRKLCVDEAVALMSKSNSNNSNKFFNFYLWATTIHSRHLAKMPDQNFPNNLVYALIMAARADAKKVVDQKTSAENLIFKFAMEGINARKISGGEQPTPFFISTEELVALINASAALLSDAEYQSSDEVKFAKKYGYKGAWLINVQTLHEERKNDTENQLYAKLVESKVLDFNRELNSDTGANVYYLDEAIEKGLNFLNTLATNEGVALLEKQFEKKVFSSIETARKEVQHVTTRLLNIFNNNPFPEDKDSSLRSLAEWDVSEWLCKLIVALKIIEKKYPEDTAIAVNMAKLMACPDIKGIYEKSLKGEFPAAKERNTDIEKLNITKLFTQPQLPAKKAASPCGVM